MAHRHRRHPGPAPAHRRRRHAAALPDRERVRVLRDQRDRHQLPGPPVREGPRGQHHGADLPQRQGPQRRLGAGQFPGPRQQLPVRVRRLPVGQRRTTGLGLLRPGRSQGGRQRQPGHAGIRGRVRRRILRPVGWRPLAGPGLQLRAGLRRARVRAAVLPDQRGQRDQAAERVHDVRRDVLGLAARTGGVHLLRLRRGHQRAAAAHRQDPGHEGDGLLPAVGTGHQQGRQGGPGHRVELAAGDLSPGQPGHRHPVLLRAQRPHRGPDLHPAGHRGRRVLHGAPVRRAAAGRQGPEGDRRGLPDGLRPPGVLHLAPDDARPDRRPGRRGGGQPARRRRRDGTPLPGGRHRTTRQRGGHPGHPGRDQFLGRGPRGPAAQLPAPGADPDPGHPGRAAGRCSCWPRTTPRPR